MAWLEIYSIEAWFELNLRLELKLMHELKVGLN